METMQKTCTAELSHVVLHCRDFPGMLDFYTRVLGFFQSDRGQARGNEMAFLSLDPSADHHMLALVTGRTAPDDAALIGHFAFRLPSLAALRERVRQAEAETDPAKIERTTHGMCWSLYFRDPENNRVEFFVDSPFYVRQPVVAPLDFSLSDEAIVKATEEAYRDTPGFCLLSEWKAKAGAKHREGRDAAD
jgi:catechol-2,3-dioxygenase